MSSVPRPYKYFDVLMAGFVTSLLVTGTVASKLFAPIVGLIFNGGALFIPINYILGGILTEIYGYARTRRVIWIGFFAAGFMSLGYWAVGQVPPAPTWPHQAAYDSILGVVPRIVAASLTAYLLGEFTNSFVLAKMKIAMRSSRFAPAPAEAKQQFSRLICIGCTITMRSQPG